MAQDRGVRWEEPWPCSRQIPTALGTAAFREFPLYLKDSLSPTWAFPGPLRPCFEHQGHPIPHLASTFQEVLGSGAESEALTNGPTKWALLLGPGRESGR